MELCKHPGNLDCIHCLIKKHPGIPSEHRLEIAWIHYIQQENKPYNIDKGCKDCRGIDQPYMVLNSVWKAAKMKKGFLCLACLEKRLNRRLKLRDFMQNAPINFGCFGFDARGFIKFRDKHPFS